MYYVIEHQIRPDGVVNVSETGRTTFTAALSFYHERASKLVASELFTSGHIMLVDEKLNTIKFDHLETAYTEQEAQGGQEATE